LHVSASVYSRYPISIPNDIELHISAEYEDDGLSIIVYSPAVQR
jgi:hypothetical protein